MQSFKIQCGTCNAKLKVSKPSTIGQSLACPRCSEMILVQPPKGWKDDSLPKADSAFEDDSFLDAIEKPVGENNSSTKQSKPKNPAPSHPQDLQETMPTAVANQVADDLSKNGSQPKKKSPAGKSKPKKAVSGSSSKKDPSHASSGANSEGPSPSANWQSKGAKKRQQFLLVGFGGIAALVIIGVIAYTVFGTGGKENGKQTDAGNGALAQGTVKNGNDEKGIGSQSGSSSDGKNDNGEQEDPKEEKQPGGKGKVDSLNPNKGEDDSSNDSDRKPKTGSDIEIVKNGTGRQNASSNPDGQATKKSAGRGDEDGSLAGKIKAAQVELLTGQKQKPAANTEQSFMDLMKQRDNESQDGFDSFAGPTTPRVGSKKLPDDPAASGGVTYIGVKESANRPSRDYRKPRLRIVETRKYLERVIPAYKNSKLQPLVFLDDMEALTGVPIWFDGESYFANPIELEKFYDVDFKKSTLQQMLDKQLPEMGLAWKSISLVPSNPEAIGILVYPIGSDQLVTKKYPMPKRLVIEKELGVAEGEKTANRSNTKQRSSNTKIAKASSGRKTVQTVLVSAPIQQDKQKSSGSQKQDKGGQQEGPTKKPNPLGDNPLSNTGKKTKSDDEEKKKEDRKKEAADAKPKRNLAAELLIRLIKSNVAPPTWKSNGGKGEIRFDGKFFVVSNTPAIQKRVERFLEQVSACLNTMKNGAAFPESLRPRAVQYGPALLKKTDIAYYKNRPLKQMLREVSDSTGLKVLVHWEAIGKQEWTPDTEVPWVCKGRPLAYAIDQLCFDMGLVYRVVGKDAVEITSKPFAEYRMDVELYPSGGLFTKDLNWQILSGRLKSFLKEDLDAFPSCQVYFDSRLGCIVARLPQKSHRKFYAYLKKQRELNKGI